MKKSEIISGSILEVPLEKDYGYGYIKLIFSDDLLPSRNIDRIVKPYNLFRSESLDKSDFIKEIFETDDLVMYPLLMIDFPNVRGEHKWIFKGIADLTEEDRIIPDYLNIGMHRKFCSKTILEETNSEFGCALVRDFQDKRIYTKEYEKIKHIGQFIHSSSRAIRSLLTMFWMDKRKDSIKEFYTKSEFEKDFWLRFTYRKIVDYDLDFTQINCKDRMRPKIEN